MSSAAADGIKHEWTGTGTSSPITLGGAVAGFQAMPSAFNGLALNYEIKHTDPAIAERENGTGVYTHSGTTLTRTAISGSSNSGAAVNFSAGTKHVSLVGLASDRAQLFDTLDATSADVTWNGSLAVPIVQVTGHTVARNLDITPAPGAGFPTRSVLACNFGAALLTVRDAGANPIGTVGQGNIRQFDWGGSVWVAGRTWVEGGSVELDSVETDLPEIEISDETHRKDLITTYEGSPSGVTVTLGNSTSEDAITVVTRGNDEEVEVVVASGVQYYLAGVDDVGVAGRTASFHVLGSVTIECFRIETGDRRYLIRGETDHEQIIENPTVFEGAVELNGGTTLGDTLDAAGEIVKANRAEVLTSVSGSLTSAAHSGRVLVTSGNVTVPNASGDVGFNATLIAGGAHTVTFNSTTSPAMASGNVMTVLVQSTTVIKAAMVEAADLVSFS